MARQKSKRTPGNPIHRLLSLPEIDASHPDKEPFGFSPPEPAAYERSYQSLGFGHASPSKSRVRFIKTTFRFSEHLSCFLDQRVTLPVAPKQNNHLFFKQITFFEELAHLLII